MDYLEYCTKARSAWPSVECLEDLSFVIYFVPDVDCLQAKRYFTWDERKDIVRELDFVFEHFSLRDSFLKAVRESRIRGKKHWKKRRWKLPLKKKTVGFAGARASGDIEIAKYNASWALKWAIENQDLSSFDVFWENFSLLMKCGVCSMKCEVCEEECGVCSVCELCGEFLGLKSKQAVFKKFIDKVEKMK